jgi:threonylcarbamoyladenosine tRNA methylthiotransferase MtaB
MDVIVGFPGETDADFSAMVQDLQGLYWNRLHVFPYSERSGTPATKLPLVVPQSVRKSRARELLKLSLDRLEAQFRQARASSETQLQLDQVLFEGEVKGPDGTRAWVAGYTPDYQRVLVPKTDTVLRNQVKSVAVKQWVVDRAAHEVMWMGVTHE